MVNTALTAAYTAAKSANPGLTPTVAPYLTFNHNTQVFELKGQSAWISGTVPTLYFNTALYNRLTSLPAKVGVDFAEIVIQSVGYNIDGSGNFTMSQSSTNLNAFYDAQQIVITTTMEIKAESIPTSTLQTRNPGSNFRRILTDYNINYLGGGFEPGNYLYYNITNTNARRISFVGDNKLDKVDFQVFWGDKLGVLHPLLIGYDQTLILKMQFSKKKAILKSHQGEHVLEKN